jgi:hypothetical protein
MDARTLTGGARARVVLVWIERAERLSGAPRGRVFENPMTEKKGAGRARANHRRGLEERRDETRERGGGRRIIAPAGMEHRGETLVMPVARVVVNRLMHLRRRGHRQHQQQVGNQRKRNGDAKGARHGGRIVECAVKCKSIA